MKNIIVTGSPGVGKTTLIKECTRPYSDFVGGFFTEEIKEGSARLGFEIKTLTGERGLFAKKGMKSQTKLNKYGIDLTVLEKLAVPAIQAAIKQNKLVVIDEIGSMEMMSPTFCETVTQALAEASAVLATLRFKAEPFTSQIKKMSDTALLHLTKENYPDTKQKVRAWMDQKAFV